MREHFTQDNKLDLNKLPYAEQRPFIKAVTILIVMALTFIGVFANL